jgi:TRAP-type C4-dicarboxylate transport system permease small subunit
VRRLARAATRVVDALAIVSFSGMFLCVLAQVVLRYVFDRPLVWSDELARYLFVWCAFLGWIVAARRRSHLAIGVLAERCESRGRALFALAAAAAALTFAALLFAYGLQITARNLDVGTVALFFSFGFVYAIVPLAALAVGIYAIADAIAALQIVRTGSPR